MVRTECRKCVHNKEWRPNPCVNKSPLVTEWMDAPDTEWEDESPTGIYNVALAPVLCPGFEAHPLTTTPVVTHESGDGETQATPDKSSVVAAPADTISAEPRKRSEDSNSQAILDGSKVSEIPTGCQCAAGPWRSDVENAPEGVYLLFYCKGCTTPFCGMRWKENTWSGANRCTCNGGGGINEFPDSEITRFAVIGGK